jgi:hypothetical protein
MSNNYFVSPAPPGGADAKWLQQVQSTVNWNFNGQATTAKRPVNAVIGQHLLDTTLNKPIWCTSVNPIVWRDASGAVV